MLVKNQPFVMSSFHTLTNTFLFHMSFFSRNFMFTFIFITIWVKVKIKNTIFIKEYK